MASIQTSAAAKAAAIAIAAGAVGAGVAAGTGGFQAMTAAEGAGPAAIAASPGDAVRLARQATFGPTPAVVDRIQALGVEGWLDEQFAMPQQSTYADLMQRVAPVGFCNQLTGQEQTNCNREYFSYTPVAMRFYEDAVEKDDQLRQRVAWALSQIIVASDVQVRSTAGLATLNQMFLRNAFGNYKDILRETALNPYMGDYLNLANSNRTNPNENFARELMQLFALGLAVLNEDGTLALDAAGNPRPVPGPGETREVARALTGWTHARFGDVSTATARQRNLDYSQPMVINAAAHDTTTKTFLGVTIPAGAAQVEELDTVINTIFAHQNLPPFVGKQLIQQLVTSNPSPQYVARVSRVFADNGAGVRGDMRAVIRAILTDPEARGDAKTENGFGKVKEPVLLSTSIARLAGWRTDGYAFLTRDAAMGQTPFRAPSVFNYYPPDYPLPLSPAGLMSPPSKLITTGTVMARHNLAYDWTVSGDARGEFNPQAQIVGATGTQPDYASWEAFGADVDGMIDRMNLIMLNNTMTLTQRQSLRAAMMAVTNADGPTQARRRAQTGLYIVASSPQFQVDR